ncbi:MAG: hypothetical protein AAF089_08235 [Bacteroidota bacterium]
MNSYPSEGYVSFPFDKLPNLDTLRTRLRINSKEEAVSDLTRSTLGLGFERLALQVSRFASPEQLSALVHSLQAKSREAGPAGIEWELAVHTDYSKLSIQIQASRWEVAITQHALYTPKLDDPRRRQRQQEWVALLGAFDSVGGVKLFVEEKSSSGSTLVTRSIKLESSTESDRGLTYALGDVVRDATLCLHGNARATMVHLDGTRPLEGYSRGREAMNTVFKGPIWVVLQKCHSYGLSDVTWLLGLGASFELTALMVKSEGECWWEGTLFFHQSNAPFFYGDPEYRDIYLRRGIYFDTFNCSREESQELAISIAGNIDI